MESTASYKTKIRYVIPATARPTLPAQQRCFAGISLGNANFEPQKLAAMAEWIDAHFDQCIILIPDSVYRLSLQISDGLTEAEAAVRIEIMAAEFIESHRDLFAPPRARRCAFEVLRSSALVQGEDYRRYLAELVSLGASDAAFDAALEAFCAAFLARRHEKEEGDPAYWRWLELSRRFVTEELAIATCLAERGYGVSIYPGSIDIFHDIAAGLHPRIPQPLRALVNVGVQFKRRSALPELAEAS